MEVCNELNLQMLDEVLGQGNEVASSNLVPILQEIQNRWGYLRREVLMELNRRTGIPASQIYGVATFYEQFYLEPHGKHTVKCCRGTACHVKGAAGIAEAIETLLGIKDGETTEDMLFTLETVACLGTCALAPVMMIDGVYHGKMTLNRAQEIIDDLKSREAC